MAISMRRLVPLAVLTVALMPCLARAKSPVLHTWSDQKEGSGRFRVLTEFGGQAVLDRETGLVWWQSPESEKPEPSGVSHLSATFRCATSRVGGRMGWRMPSLDEILTLATTDEPPGGIALPSTHPFDVNPMDHFWTHTQLLDADGTVAYFRVEFQDDGGGDPNASPPIMAVAPPSSDAHAWCVRAPGGSGATTSQAQ